MNNLVLIGAGLIGGSLALDLKKSGLVNRIMAIDTDQQNLNCALERGLIDQGSTIMEPEWLRQADMVVIATPVATLPLICRQLAGYVHERAVITDVGSTKQLALQAFAAELPQHYARCVAAHPIAGSDRYGAQAARTGLFEHKKCIVCPHEKQDSQALSLVLDMWRSVGAEVTTLPAGEHDHLLAAVSHLPHMLAYAYMHQLAEYPDIAHILQFAGSGFGDFSRIAASHPRIWTDICLANRQSLMAMLQEQQETLRVLQQCLHEQDREALNAFFLTAQRVRESWQQSSEN